jgi:hypothetical protein
VAPGFQFFATRRYVLLTFLFPLWNLFLMSLNAESRSSGIVFSGYFKQS